MGGNLKIIDPIVTTSGDTLIHAYMIYDKLFEFDESGVPLPQLAEKVDISADNKSFTIKLRDGLKFSDGTPITSDDVIQSLTRWASRDQTGQLLRARTKDLVKIDDNTLRIDLTESFDVPSALAGITGNPAFIMPKRVASLPPTEALTDTVGSGPYQFDFSTWKPGQMRVYTKNSYYIPRDEAASFYAGRKEAVMDRIEFSYVPDPNTAMASMLTGKQDIWLDPPMANAVALRNNPNLKVVKGLFSSRSIRHQPRCASLRQRQGETGTYVFDRSKGDKRYCCGRSRILACVLRVFDMQRDLRKRIRVRRTSRSSKCGKGKRALQ